MNNNINKNVSVWRGNNTPPTDYHLWIKSDGNMFINDGQEFQDYKVVSGVDQDIKDINNVLYSQYTSAKITVNPTIIEKGVNNSVTIKWESSFNGQVITPDATEVKQGGVTFSNTPNYSVSRTLTNTTDFSLSITYKGITKTASARVNAYYPKYYGQSTKTTLTSSDILGFTKQAISSNVSGSGSMSVSEGNYVWFCVPSNMTINKITSSGFDVPMEAPINVEVSGKGTYKCYRSSNTFKAGTFTYQIS